MPGFRESFRLFCASTGSCWDYFVQQDLDALQEDGRRGSTDAGHQARSAFPAGQHLWEELAVWDSPLQKAWKQNTP